MAVKASGTGAKILAVLDAVARGQPVGVSELARSLGENKSMVQRMLVTLAEEGWIRPERTGTTKWRMTQRIRLLADLACPENDLKVLAREAMEKLRDDTGETASLVVRDAGRFIVVDVAESEALLRVAPKIGQEVPGPVSASSLAMLPHLALPDQIAVLGTEPSAALLEQFEAIRRDGYAVLESELGGGTVSIAAPISMADDGMAGVLVLSAPVGRLPASHRHVTGVRVQEAALAIPA